MSRRPRGAPVRSHRVALDKAMVLGAKDRALLLDWWATALDRGAQLRTEWALVKENWK